MDVDALGPWSPRARAWLRRVGIARRGTPLGAGALAGHLPETLAPERLAELAAFEARWGGVLVDHAGHALELGVGDLVDRGILPEHADDGRLLAGTTRDAHLYLAVDGQLWAAGADLPGVLATSVNKLVERWAAEAALPEAWHAPAFCLLGDARDAGLVDRLFLERDEAASDATYELAASDRHVLRAPLRGSTWRCEHAALYCRDLDAVVAVLRLGWPSALAKGHPELPADADTIELGAADGKLYRVDLVAHER